MTMVKKKMRTLPKKPESSSLAEVLYIIKSPCTVHRPRGFGSFRDLGPAEKPMIPSNNFAVIPLFGRNEPQASQ
jgi:hypothetical protein